VPKSCEIFRKRMPFIDDFLKHFPTLSECKAVITWRVTESLNRSLDYRSLRTFKDFSAAASAISSS
jgi:hypothetical protein